MNKLVLLKDQSGVWWLGSAEATDTPTPPNPITVSWPQLFLEHIEPPSPLQPQQNKVQLGLGSPFASFRVPQLVIAWTALATVPEIDNNPLCKMYGQAVQRAKGSSIVIPDVRPGKPPSEKGRP